MDKHWISIFIVGYIIVLAIINILAIPSAGTIDARNWEAVFADVAAHGNHFIPDCLSGGCPSNFILAKFPPGFFLLFYLFSFLFPPQILGTLLSTKLLIFTFYLVTLGAIIWFARDVKSKLSLLQIVFVYLSLLSLILNTQALAYTDILTFPFFVASTLFLIKGRYTISGAFFGASMLTKWQPIILLPIFVLYAIKHKEKHSGIVASMKFFLGIFGVIALFYPLSPDIVKTLLGSLSNALSHRDPFALNIPWIIAGAFGSTPSMNPGSQFAWALRPITVIFSISYVGLLFGYSISKEKEHYRTKNFLTTLLLTISTYFFLSFGVHENHFILGTLIALLLYMADPSKQNRIILLVVDIMNFVNMFLFYGFLGVPVMPRIVMGLDLSVFFASLFSLLFFTYYVLWISKVLRK